MHHAPFFMMTTLRACELSADIRTKSLPTIPMRKSMAFPLVRAAAKNGGRLETGLGSILRLAKSKMSPARDSSFARFKKENRFPRPQTPTT